MIVESGFHKLYDETIVQAGRSIGEMGNEG